MVSFFIRLAVPVGVNVLWLQLGYFAPYVVLFVTGCLFARHQVLERVTFAEARPWAITSGVMFILLPIVMVARGDRGTFTGGWTFNAAFYALWDPFRAWGVILTLFWSFRTYFSRSNRFTGTLASQAFAAYIMHPPVVVGLSLLAEGWSLVPLAKFAVVGARSCGDSFLVAAALRAIPGTSRVL